MATGPARGVEGLLPLSASPRSLLSVPGVVLSDAQAPDHWRNGIEFQPESCTLELDLDEADANDQDWPYWWECVEGAGTLPTAEAPGGIKTVNAGRDRVRTVPWTYWVGFRCSSLDVRTDARRAEVTARINRKLAACRSATVERELWTGQVAALAGFPNPYLASDDVDNVPGSFGYVTALAELEQRLAEKVCVGTRMIHAQPRVVTAWASDGLVAWNPATTRLETAVGSVVVPGDGYTGSAPDGGIDGRYNRSHVYGTGPVRVIVGSEVKHSLEDITAVTPSVNDVVVRAEQDVAIVFDPCAQVGVEVNLCDRLCGGGS